MEKESNVMTANELGEAFLQELWDLCQKHGAEISGCGCCKSPWASVGLGTPLEARFDCLSVTPTGGFMYQHGLPYGVAWITLGSGGRDARSAE